MHFIEFELVHPNNIEGDSTVAIRPEEIRLICKATAMDRKQRADIGCLVHLKGGDCYAVTMGYKEVLEKLESVV